MNSALIEIARILLEFEVEKITADSVAKLPSAAIEETTPAKTAQRADRTTRRRTGQTKRDEL